MLNQFEELRDTLYKFVETRVDLLEVETRSHIERIILKVAYGLLVLITAVVLLVFLLILLGAYLNQVLQSPYAGYLIVSGVILVKLILLFIFRKRFVKLIRWGLVQAFDQDD